MGSTGGLGAGVWRVRDPAPPASSAAPVVSATTRVHRTGVQSAGRYGTGVRWRAGVAAPIQAVGNRPGGRRRKGGRWGAPFVVKRHHAAAPRRETTLLENRWALHVAGAAALRGKINVVADATLSPT